MKKAQNFIDKSKKTHGDKYDYSKVDYINSTTKVCIICKKHGEFWQTPSAHVRGDGCPMCGNENRGNLKRLSKDEFISRANSVHNNKYTYDNVDYRNINTIINITCPIHGEFKQTPNNHLNGEGCPKCVGRNLSQDNIIEKFKEKHGNKYDYSLVKFTRVHDKVEIICPIHGKFEQTPSKHLKGQGCPKCGVINRSKEKAYTTEEYVCQCKEKWGDTYDYSKVNYVNANSLVDIICRKHGIFSQRAHDHVLGHGCPRCANIQSEDENELYEYICSIVGKENVIKNDRKVLDGLEIDILIPSMKIGFEYDGLIWHSEKYGKDSSFHLNKTLKAKEKGITLIHIFEDEYKNKKDIVESKIKHILKADTQSSSIYARNTIVEEIDKNISKDFLEKYHIQGSCGCSIALGCFYKDELIGVMLFLKIKDKYLLSRFATNTNYICCGIGGKILSFFIKKYNPSIIETFLDIRWSHNEDNNLYTKIGFKIDSIIKPTYWYVKNSSIKERIHKFNCRKEILHKKYNFPLSMREKEMTEQLGLTRIYDCGLIKYVWKK